MDLSIWALPQLFKLLPLDNESLKQIISNAENLPNPEAADYLQDLLGESPQSLEFITSFNSRRKPKPTTSYAQASASNADSGVPKAKPKKKKPGIAKLLPPRQVENLGNVAGAYRKPEEEDYMAGGPKLKAPKANPFSLSDKPEAVQKPTTSSGTATPKSRGVSPAPPPGSSAKLPPSAAGALIGDLKPSRNSSPKPKTKVSVQGGTPMQGASTALNDLDSAIRALEIQTNPSLSSSQDNRKRKCNCMATRHPLLEAAPNCLNCGKIICVKEGIGPCTFCNSSLLSSGEIQNMMRVLKEERGKEKMAANNASQKRADVSMAPRPFAASRDRTPVASAPASDSESEKLAKAKQHRDKLLAFQAQNAKRTQVHDEAADFETPTSGLSQWASPQERAMQLKRQQKALREQEWNARPEYEKRTVVASIDLKGGKIVRRMAAVQRPATPESEDELTETDYVPAQSNSGGGGAFSRNPLLGGLIRPTFKAPVDVKGKGKVVEAERKQTWRRVQDENEDNEHWILDGGVYGGQTKGGEQDGGR
ncbi:zf-C2HC5-domain-containing protein [Pleomassaria siparia CBS 279.74]|uniref:Zf-C2HC5-domain-containing protein n=1 Tax=Pleomassaria siparia CBS 279.74 TaxID=1314801 RepID=A0A6G1K798_9PLEO|nr:zf-C2HC5-domain-containing protein [Pleomassaria siparia CBS 279.74]